MQCGNDVAAISTTIGMVVISAFTFNNKDHSWGRDHEAEVTIAKLARAIIQSWSPRLFGCVANTAVGERLPFGMKLATVLWYPLLPIISQSIHFLGLTSVL